MAARRRERRRQTPERARVTDFSLVALERPAQGSVSVRGEPLADPPRVRHHANTLAFGSERSELRRNFSLLARRQRPGEFDSSPVGVGSRVYT